MIIARENKFYRTKNLLKIEKYIFFITENERIKNFDLQTTPWTRSMEIRHDLLVNG